MCVCVCVLGFDVKSLCVMEHSQNTWEVAGRVEPCRDWWQDESLWPLCCLRTGDREVCAVATWESSEAAPGLLASWPGFHGPLLLVGSGTASCVLES